MSRPAQDWALLEAEEQLNQDWWKQQDSDEEWIAQQENASGHDAVRGK